MDQEAPEKKTQTRDGGSGRGVFCSGWPLVGWSVAGFMARCGVHSGWQRPGCWCGQGNRWLLARLFGCSMRHRGSQRSLFVRVGSRLSPSPMQSTSPCLLALLPLFPLHFFLFPLFFPLFPSFFPFLLAYFPRCGFSRGPRALVG